MFDRSTEILYARSLDRGRRGQAWSALTGRSRRLLALAEIDTTCTVEAHCYAEIQSVPICQISGSQGRSYDFDCDFNPLQDHTKIRWLGIATARKRGKVLPPVELIQVGDLYFVQDGHHRISVAQALGQRDIEAQVTLWQVARPLPWEESAPHHRLISQETGIERLYQKIRHGSTRLKEHFQLSLHNLFIAVGMRWKERMVS